jgi:hypothetical protein
MLGWSDRHGFRGNEVGSLQPNTVFCPCPKSIVASCATAASAITSVHRRGEQNGEPHSEPRLSCAVHPSMPEETIEIRCHQHHLLLKRPRKRKKAKGSFGFELQEPVRHVLMLESPPRPLYLLGNIEKGKRQKKIFAPVHFSNESAKQ